MSVRRSFSHAILTGLLASSAPAVALAQPVVMTPGSIFANAAPSMKIIMVVLVLALMGAVVATARKLMSGPHLSGGSSYLSALRLGAPLLGLLGAAFNLLMMFIGLANFGPQPINVLAPGLAEGAFLLVLGLTVGVIAVVCHGAVEARVDRMVLKA